MSLPRLSYDTSNEMAHAREFGTGATQDDQEQKPDYEGYLSPLVIERFGQYMMAHQHTSTGFRASDNWQMGIPIGEYIKSLWRHFMALWKTYRRSHAVDQEAACAILFNTMGLLHETLKDDKPGAI